MSSFKYPASNQCRTCTYATEPFRRFSKDDEYPWKAQCKDLPFWTMPPITRLDGGVYDHLVVCMIYQKHNYGDSK
jgi:hypothetical protein